MKSLQDIRFEQGITPVDLNGGAATGIAIDLGSTYAPICQLACLIAFGNVAAANSAGTFLIETSNSSTFASGNTTLTGGTFADYTSTSADAKNFVAFVQPGGGLKRYIRVSITGGAGATLISATWLIVGGVSPNSITERNVVQNLFAGV